jgi:hypothetical protein
MNNVVLLRLERVRKKNRENICWRNHDLYKFLYKEELYLFVWESFGFIDVSPDVLKDVPNLIKLLRKNTGFSGEFSIQMNFENQGLTDLGNLLRRVIIIILEAVYGLSLGNFGVEPHCILRNIHQDFARFNWVILGERCVVDDKLVFCYLAEKIPDVRFLSLIKTLIKFERSFKSSSNFFPFREGNGFLSVVLIDLYFRKLDLFLQAQKRFFHGFFNYQSSSSFISEKIKNCFNTQVTLKLGDSLKPEFDYMRYESSWLIGVSGEKKFLIFLKDTLNVFLASSFFGYNANFIKIFYLRGENFLFLDHIIGLRTVLSSSGFCSKTYVRLELPISYLLKKLFLNGFCDKMGLPTAQFSWISFENRDIITRFNKILNDLFTYYSGVDNFSHLLYIQYVLKGSCARTLAYKHRVSLSISYKTFGYHFCDRSSSYKEGGIARDTLCLVSRKAVDFRKKWSIVKI